MNLDDPKLTAFALNELDEPERSTIARAIAESPEAKRVVDETREMARALKNECAAELEKDATLPTNLIDIRDDPWFWSVARPLAVAAVIAVCAIVAGIAVLPLKRGEFRGARVYLPPATGPRRSKERFSALTKSKPRLRPERNPPFKPQVDLRISARLRPIKLARTRFSTRSRIRFLRSRSL